jgi:hypothetical protein
MNEGGQPDNIELQTLESPMGLLTPPLHVIQMKRGSLNPSELEPKTPGGYPKDNRTSQANCPTGSHRRQRTSHVFNKREKEAKCVQIARNRTQIAPSPYGPSRLGPGTPADTTDSRSAPICLAAFSPLFSTRRSLPAVRNSLRFFPASPPENRHGLTAIAEFGW